MIDERKLREMIDTAHDLAKDYRLRSYDIPPGPTFTGTCLLAEYLQGRVSAFQEILLLMTQEETTHHGSDND